MDSVRLLNKMACSTSSHLYETVLRRLNRFTLSESGQGEEPIETQIGAAADAAARAMCQEWQLSSGG